ncbi:MAG TPA: hypothetical protein VL442_08870 [Mucilaginibacter sp.]|jgi:hypothetical protein|nr:hypothetical protein [Mucilaginibacter sp.]
MSIKYKFRDQERLLGMKKHTSLELKRPFKTIRQKAEENGCFG